MECGCFDLFEVSGAHIGDSTSVGMVSAGYLPDPAQIQELMPVAHGAPVLWVNVKALDPVGPWAESSMLRWNAALAQACHQYPNLRVFDWAAVARRGWFISDGIHYTSAGYAARARMIAHALARAFPGTGSGTGCLIG